MKFVKCNRDKIISITLVLSVLIVTSINAVNLFSNKGFNLLYSPNNVLVQKVDDNHARVHCDAVKMSRNDFLFCKSENSIGTFQYDICDLDNSETFFSFNSPTDITLADCAISNAQLGAGAWALAGGATGAGALSAVGGIVSGIAKAGTIGAAATGAAATAGAAAAGGAASAAAGLGFMAGAKVAGAVVLTAVGPGVILAGTGAAIGIA